MMQDCIAVYGEPALQTPTREQLIMEHLPQVRWIATRIHEKLPSTFALEDLISTGIIGLINAIDNYDPTHSAQLKTFAEFKIRGAILDSLRGLDGIPAHRRKDVKLMEAAINSLEQRLGRTPREEEIAAELSMPLAHYQNWLLDLRAVHIGSLDAPVNRESGATMLQFIADSSDQDPARQIERSALESLITEALRRLPEPERLVLTLYYKEGQNLREIAPIMDLHITRVSQLKAQGILRLRAFMAAKWPSGRGGIRT
jgi:RNA polymerase sigma factor FliA